VPPLPAQEVAHHEGGHPGIHLAQVPPQEHVQNNQAQEAHQTQQKKEGMSEEDSPSEDRVESITKVSLGLTK